MPRSPGSTRRSAGERHGACEDRRTSAVLTRGGRTTTCCRFPPRVGIRDCPNPRGLQLDHAFDPTEGTLQSLKIHRPQGQADAVRYVRRYREWLGTRYRDLLPSECCDHLISSDIGRQRKPDQVRRGRVPRRDQRIHWNPATLVTPWPFDTCVSICTWSPCTRFRSSEEGHMCPACIASAAVMVAGAGSAGGILAVCIGKFRKFFRANRLGLFQKTKEK
jgi:hypothetical protein